LLILGSTVRIDEIPNETIFFVNNKDLNREFTHFLLSNIKNFSIKTNKKTTRSPIGRGPNPGKVSITTNRVQPRILKVFYWFLVNQ
jgi:hypothetical protein